MFTVLALATYVVATVVAVGYAGAAGLTPARRVAAGLLALTVSFVAGWVLASPGDGAGPHAVGIPAVLLLGMLMTFPAPRRPAPAGAVDLFAGRPLSHAAAALVAAPPRQIPRRVPVLYDPWAALYASMAVRDAGPATSTVPEAPVGTATRRAGRRVTRRIRGGRSTLPRSLSRSSRCRRR